MTDPCVAATFVDPTIGAMTVQNGATATEDFLETTDSVDAINVIVGLCGDRNYGIYDGNTGTPNVISWMSIAEDTPSVGTHRITATPLDTSLVTGAVLNYYVKTTYANYPSHAAQYTALNIQVTAANCDCELLTWDNPSRTDVTVNIGDITSTTIAIPTAAANTASKSAS